MSRIIITVVLGVCLTSCVYKKDNAAPPDIDSTVRSDTSNIISDTSSNTATETESGNTADMENTDGTGDTADTSIVTGIHPVIAFRSGKCLDIQRDDNDLKNLQNTRLNQWECAGYPSQRWNLKKKTNGFYEIISTFNDKCLEANTAEETGIVVLAHCTGSTTQQWELESLQNNTFAIVYQPYIDDTDSGNGAHFCLDIVDDALIDGALIQLWPCHYGYNQSWLLEDIYITEGMCSGKRPTPEICDNVDNDCDGDIDENCDCVDSDTQTCGIQLGECTKGTQTCVNGKWSVCDGEIEPVTEMCDGRDNNCDGAVDEGCDCINGDTEACGSSMGLCSKGVQSCTGGKWSTCIGEVPPQSDICDGNDNDCDGDIDEGCDCINGDTEACGSNMGICREGVQSCINGNWSGCMGSVKPTNEICDSVDNDCDGEVDEGFHMDATCNAAGTCPQTRVCSVDGKASICQVDERLFRPEECDGVDNDCDGLVDMISHQGELQSVCSCRNKVLDSGESFNVSMDNSVDFCMVTQCSGRVIQLEVDDKCYSACQFADSDPDGDGWGWENDETCIVANSVIGQSASACSNAETSDKFMSISYCLDCSGDEQLPYAMCQTKLQYDMSAFGRGKEWLMVDYTYSAVGPAQIPINLWFSTAGESQRKYFPLIRIGDSAGRYEKTLRINDACYTPSAVFGAGCGDAPGTQCSHCAADTVCGAIDECGAYDMSHAWLQIAAEFCGSNSGEHRGIVTLNEVRLVEANCTE
ncbi:MAG: RICIN domain-containing protein [Deltaproteobacteria bacterium]|nr:RICIN domain-containing protein [Deltaproteobacteria bacterium]